MGLRLGKSVFVRPSIWLASLCLASLPAASFGDAKATPPAADAATLSAQCATHKIIGTNAGISQIAFLDKAGAVIDTLKGPVRRDGVAIQILGCSDDFFFVTTAAGVKAKVRRIDVLIDGKCQAAVVSDPTRNVAATSGLGVC